MINRTLIRLKIVQLIYEYYQNGNRSIEAVGKELMYSLSKAYELYNLLLCLMIDLTRYADEVINKQEEINRVTHANKEISHRLLENKFIAILEKNKMLNQYREEKKLSWMDDKNYLKYLYDIIVQSEYYADYLAPNEVTFDDDREFWRKVYKNIIMKDTEIDDIIEDMCIYWNDDKETVDTFVIKTIKRFTAESTEEQPLMPEFRDEEDVHFADRLLRRTIENAEYYQSLISQSAHNWELNRIAFMDLVIMQVAIAEILSFPEIPVSVTINEYIELAKCYSTPKSHIYINGIVDNVAKRLRNAGKLMK
ncbi:MAG: transcription antitermination factor NusB [Bacteroidaceae bacterium]|nr:transcription antitermination factor NusB [Bacteroidaceae bacterium]